MRKSNWIVVGILAVASVMFLAMWYVFKFNYVDNPFDIVLTICWWAIIITACVIITMVERRRQRVMRTMFIAPGVVYNADLGVVNLSEGEDYVPVMKDMLTKLDYGFEKKEIESDSRIHFKYIVHTDKFASDGNTWVGDVVKVTKPNEHLKFDGEGNLIGILKSAGIA